MNWINQFKWETVQLKFPKHYNPIAFQGLGDSFSAPENKAKKNLAVSIADIEFNDNWIAVLGDIHGDADALKIAVEACKQASIKHLFQVGDFGYLFHHNPANHEELKRDPEDRVMDQILKEAYDDFGLTLHVIDGNHDNHLLYHRGRSSMEPRVINKKWNDTELPSMPLYHPRGSTVAIEFDGGFDTNGNLLDPIKVQFGFLGGARSINVPPREEKMREGWDFWFDEEPTDVDVSALIENFNSDNDADTKLLITHEAATDYYLKKGLKVPAYMEALTAQTRNRVAQVVNETAPALHVHGHWHQLATGVYDGYKGRTNLLCLAEEKREGNLAFINLDGADVVIPQVFVEFSDNRTDGMPHRIL